MRSQEHKERRQSLVRRSRFCRPYVKYHVKGSSRRTTLWPQSRSEHLKRNGALSARAKAGRRHEEEFVNRLVALSATRLIEVIRSL